MNKYYIWRESTGTQDFTNYALATKKGKFVGVGNFCGYYSDTWIDNAGVIAQGYGVYTDHTKTYYKYSIERCEDRQIKDSYQMPEEFEAEDDDKAFNYFKEYCKENMEKW